MPCSTVEIWLAICGSRRPAPSATVRQSKSRSRNWAGPDDMAVRIRLKSKSIKSQLGESIEQTKRRMQEMAATSATQFGEDVQREGRADIASAGNFGGRWISGFTYDISKGDKSKTITFHHSV